MSCDFIANIDWDQTLDIAGTVLGLAYLWLEYRANIWLWLVGVIMPIVNAWLYFNRGVYADFGMQVYYVLAAVYGWAMWRRGDRNRSSGDTTLGIRHARAGEMAAIVAGLLVLWGALYLFLSRCTDSTVPVYDAFTTAACIMAMWALAQKWVEQWLLWFAVDAVCAPLYFHKDIPFHGALYAFYTVMAVVGYLRWHRISQQGDFSGEASDN